MTKRIIYITLLILSLFAIAYIDYVLIELSRVANIPLIQSILLLSCVTLLASMTFFNLIHTASAKRWYSEKVLSNEIRRHKIINKTLNQRSRKLADLVMISRINKKKEEKRRKR